MAWAGGVFDSTYGVDTSGLTAGMQTYYDKKFLLPYAYSLRLAPLGQKRDLPEGAGKTIEFFRYMDITPGTAAASAGGTGTLLTEGTNPDPMAISAQTLQATLAEYGAFSQHSSLISRRVSTKMGY